MFHITLGARNSTNQVILKQWITKLLNFLYFSQQYYTMIMLYHVDVCCTRVFSTITDQIGCNERLMIEFVDLVNRFLLKVFLIGTSSRDRSETCSGQNTAPRLANSTSQSKQVPTLISGYIPDM